MRNKLVVTWFPDSHRYQSVGWKICIYRNSDNITETEISNGFYVIPLKCNIFNTYKKRYSSSVFGGGLLSKGSCLELVQLIRESRFHRRPFAKQDATGVVVQRPEHDWTPCQQQNRAIWTVMIYQDTVLLEKMCQRGELLVFWLTINC